ncbi:MAG: hypothetical protein JWL81_2963 [Verrucomicrobiales bacterium]|nr:hypothetical protein [Verrucomicrobiales bacterium]
MNRPTPPPVRIQPAAPISRAVGIARAAGMSGSARIVLAMSLVLAGPLLGADGNPALATPATPSAPAVAPAAAPVESTAFFETHIQPLLKAHCHECHSGDHPKNNLRLDSIGGLLEGGESGEPVLVPSDPAASQILNRATSSDPHFQMPPKGERLTEVQTGLIKEWIRLGAPLPGGATFKPKSANTAKKITTTHWSFQPVRRPAEPASPSDWKKNAVDSFILEKLGGESLAPSSLAERRTLIRRLFLVMHGLPPSPAEVDNFINDADPRAWENLVDRVLASPRYGERWARHWLDVARYADSNGFETNRERKTAWPYRDYVIGAFNSDKPYDRFVREQIAGDALGADAATGFLVAGAYDIVKSPDINLSLAQRQDELADMVNTTGTAFMGMTLGCARCHDHKFDPVPQRDFYSMQAVFAGVTHGERPLPGPRNAETEKKSTQLLAVIKSLEKEVAGLRREAETLLKNPSGHPLRPPVNARMNTEEFQPVEAMAVRFTILATTGAEPCVDEFELLDAAGRNVGAASAGAIPTASGTYPDHPLHRLPHLNDGLPGNSHSWISNTSGTGWIQLDLPAKTTIQSVRWSRDREGNFPDRLATSYLLEYSATAGAADGWKPLTSSATRQPYDPAEAENTETWLFALPADQAKAARLALRKLKDAKKELETLTQGAPAWLGTFSQPALTHRLYRGDPLQPREITAPDALSVIGGLNLKPDEPEQNRRVKLAEWMTRPEHPLTARVMVNRIWHYCFGRGIVDTPGDFGVNGGRPTHAELLDWLADEFVRSGWSVKHLQRLILTSATFQQSSMPRAGAATVDAEARLLWRFPPRRLEAEAIRDSMLAVSGALNPAAGGPGFYLMDVEVENVMHYHVKEKFGPDEFRRMVYQTRIRQTTDGLFGSFDCPDGSQVMAKRSRSNTPLQALNLFNSPFVLQQSQLLAERLRGTGGATPEASVATAFPLILGRPADAFELEKSSALIRAEGLEAFCRALYNTSEFLFIF